MIILASTGPVISVRRRCSALGSGATFQSPSRMCLGFRQEVGHFAGVDAGLALDAGLQQFLATRLEGAVQLGDQFEGFQGEDGFVARFERGVDLHALRAG
jgi:hypothetical protein